MSSPNSPDPSYASPQQKSPYDFIVNENKKPKRSLLPSGLSFRKKLLVLIGGAVIVMIIIALVSSLLLKGSEGSLAQLREIAKQQQELIRVADTGSRKARSSSAMNLAVTAKATLVSDQKATLAYLTAQKQQIPAKELSESKNATTDQLFTRAEQANQFDEVFTSTIQTELTAYRSAVKKAHDETSSKKLKALLADNYNHVSALIGTTQQ